MLWRRVQPQLSTVTQVCSYDRAGHGWSQTRENPRDAEVIVHELHALLEKARVRRPFIYVGHSAGGLYVREYAREYPMISPLSRCWMLAPLIRSTKYPAGGSVGKKI